jgi:hypothetical protein
MKTDVASVGGLEVTVAELHVDILAGDAHARYPPPWMAMSARVAGVVGRWSTPMVMDVRPGSIPMSAAATEPVHRMGPMDMAPW